MGGKKQEEQKEKLKRFCPILIWFDSEGIK